MIPKIQRCALCDEPTGRCEDDAIRCRGTEPICEDCFDETYHEFVADALAEFREAVLHGLDGFDNDQTNAVLSLFDDILGEFMG